MKQVKKTLQHQLIVRFTALLSVCCLLLVGNSVYSILTLFEDKNDIYFTELALQVTNNLQHGVDAAEAVTIDLMTDPTVLSVLQEVNSTPLSVVRRSQLDSAMDTVLYDRLLADDNISMLSVFSVDGVGFSAKQNMLDPTPTPLADTVIYEGKGSLLWTVNDDDRQNLYAARPIYDTRTMTILGYVGVLYKASFFGDILHDIAVQNTRAFLVNEEGMVLSANDPTVIGTPFTGVDLNALPTTLYDSDTKGRYQVYVGDEMANDWRMVLMIPVSQFEGEAWRYIATSLAVALVVVLLCVRIVVLLTAKLTTPLQVLSENMARVGKGDFSVQTPVTTEDEVGALTLSYNRMVTDINLLIEQNYQLEIAKRQTELEFLKMQINPHFLYNTLDTIGWSARIHKVGEIADMTVSLGSLLRAVVHQSDRITVTQELENIHHYLAIQQVRFGEKLTFEQQIDPAVTAVCLPNFLIQPLVENAIIHGIEPKRGRGKVQLVVGQEGDRLSVSVSDDGVGIDADSLAALRAKLQSNDSRHCIGLLNVNKRLSLYYGKTATFCIDGEIDKGFCVRFTLPIGG